MRHGGYGSQRAIAEPKHKNPDDKIHEIVEHYKHYSIASNAADKGDHRAEADCMTCLEYMLKSVCEFMEMLEENAGSPEEVQLIKEYKQKMAEEI